MPNRWTNFVKDWASENNMAYGCALSKPEMKIAYYKKYPKSKNTKQVIPIEYEKLEEASPSEEQAKKIVQLKITKKAPIWTETLESKEKRKSIERDNVMRALHKGVSDLIYNKEMSLSDALLTMFPDIDLTTQKLRSLPQILKNGEYTGKLLLYWADDLKNVGWFMEYVDKILRGNFSGINKKRYEAIYDKLNDSVGVVESRMFEMEEEDTRAKSKREYLKSPFNKFYVGEEVKSLFGNNKGRAIVVKQTKSGVTLKPKEGGKTFNIKNKDMDDSFKPIQKIIEEMEDS